MKTPTTPLRLVQRTVLGSGLVLLAYLFSFLVFRDRRSDLGSFFHLLWSARLELIVTALLFLAGVALILINHSRLQKHLRRNVWTETQIEKARRWINLPAISWAQGVLIVGLIGSWIALSLRHHPHFAGTGAIICLTIQPVTAVRFLLRKSQPPNPPTDWSQSAPIRSNHWGHPSA